MRQDDSLEKRLKKQLQGASSYIADDGFTDSVMTELRATQGKAKLKKSPTPQLWCVYLLVGMGAMLFTGYLASMLSIPDVAHSVTAWVMTLDLVSIVTGAAVYAGAVVLLGAYYAARVLDLI